MENTVRYGFLILCTLLFSSASSQKGETTVREGIHIHLEYIYGLGTQIKYRPYLLFQDGSIYKNMDSDPSTLDISVSKKTEAEHWGEWRQTGKEIHVLWKNGKKTVWKDKSWFPTVSPKEKEQLSGSYKSISGLSSLPVGGDATVLSIKDLTFEGDRFTFGTSAGSGNSQTTSYTSQEKAGTYLLGKNSIQLRFNNGKMETKFFFFAPDSKRSFGIGSTYYILRE